jgi:hypothetical protein
MTLIKSFIQSLGGHSLEHTSSEIGSHYSFTRNVEQMLLQRNHSTNMEDLYELFVSLRHFRPNADRPSCSTRRYKHCTEYSLLGVLPQEYSEYYDTTGNRSIVYTGNKLGP